MVTSGTDLGTLCFMVSPGEIWEFIIYCLNASRCTQIHNNIAPVNLLRVLTRVKLYTAVYFSVLSEDPLSLTPIEDWFKKKCS